jgi:hypothetical protein
MEWEESNEKVFVVAERMFSSGVYYYSVRVINVGSVLVTVTSVVLMKPYNFSNPSVTAIVSPPLPVTINPGSSALLTLSTTDRDVTYGFVITTRSSYSFTIKNVILY